MDGTTPDYTAAATEREAALALQINQAIGGEQVDVILNAMTRVMSAVLASVRHDDNNVGDTGPLAETALFAGVVVNLHALVHPDPNDKCRGHADGRARFRQDRPRGHRRGDVPLPGAVALPDGATAALRCPARRELVDVRTAQPAARGWSGRAVWAGAGAGDPAGCSRWPACGLRQHGRSPGDGRRGEHQRAGDGVSEGWQDVVITLAAIGAICFMFWVANS